MLIKYAIYFVINPEDDLHYLATQIAVDMAILY